MVSWMLAPCPRRVSAAVCTTDPSVLTPPGSVGASSLGEPFELLPQVVPFHGYRGALLAE